MRRITYRSLRSRTVAQLLPLFPINVPIVPGLVLPLHIFEPRYRGLVQELLDQPDPESREFGIVALREGRSLERDGIGALYEIGTATVLREADELEDGRFDIVTTGSRRFTLEELDLSRPLARAKVTWLDEPTGDVTSEQIEAVSRAFSTYQELLGLGLGGGEFDDEEDEEEELPRDPVVLSYLVTAAMVLPVGERQSLLSCVDASQRLTLARSILARENGLIATFGAVPALDLGLGTPSKN